MRKLRPALGECYRVLVILATVMKTRYSLKHGHPTNTIQTQVVNQLFSKKKMPIKTCIFQEIYKKYNRAKSAQVFLLGIEQKQFSQVFLGDQYFCIDGIT